MSDQSGRAGANGAAGHKPLVSVVTPVWNSEPWLRDCTNSVRAAFTGGRFKVEHICVDDGSTDDSLELLHRIAAEDLDPLAGYPHHTGDWYGLKVVAHPKVGRPSLLRNEGVRRAGRLPRTAPEDHYLFFLDSDDVLLQNSLRYLLQHLQAHPQCGWAYGDFLRTESDLQYTIGKDYWGWPHATASELLHSVFRGDHFYQHSFLVRRTLFDRVGGYDPEIGMGEDLDLCSRLVMEGFLPTHLPIQTHLHRERGTNLTANFGWEEHIGDVRNHYRRHKFSLSRFLSADQITDVERRLKLAPAAAAV